MRSNLEHYKRASGEKLKMEEPVTVSVVQLGQKEGRMNIYKHTPSSASFCTRRAPANLLWTMRTMKCMAGQ